MINAYRQQEASLSGPQGSSGNLAGQTRSRDAKPFFNLWRLGFICVLIISVVAYLPSLLGQKIWDDEKLLNGSGIGGGTSALQALTHPFLGAYFRPLVSLSFYFENKWFTGTPFYYHQTNILLHMFTCAALIGFVLLAFGSRRLALLSGLIFAIQPAQVSAVAWIGGRTDSLCALLVVLFAYTLVLGVRASGMRRVGWIVLSTIAFFLAAVTKEQIIALLPLVPFALRAFGPEEPKPEFKTYARLTAPYVLAAVIFAALWLLYNTTPLKALVQTPINQFATAGQTAVFYTFLYLAPSGKWMHTLSLGALQDVGWPSAACGLLLLCVYLIGTYLLVRRSPKIGWVVCLAALALLPVSNLIPLPSLFVAPYRAGVAGLGVAVLFAWVGLKMSRNLFLATAGLAFLVWCGWLTVWGASQWKDPVTLFSRIASEDPHSIIARRNLGSYLLQVGRSQESITQMKSILGMLYGSDAWQNPQTAYEEFRTNKVLGQRVLENQGNEVKPEAWLGELFSQLGFAEAKTKDFPASKKAFETAVMIDPRNIRPRIGLAQFAMFENKPEVALRNLRIAVASQPDDPQLLSMEGDVYSETGKLGLAEQSYRQSINAEPWFGPTYQDLAEVQVKRHEVGEAIKTLQSALKCTVLDAKGINTRIAQLQQLQGKEGNHAL